jgi:hypothetical protein
MSLVYEALQKAEREKERKTGATPPPAAVAPPAPAPASPARSWTAVWIVTGAVILLAGGLYAFVVGMRAFAEKQTATLPAPVAEVARPAPVENPPPAPPPPVRTANDDRFKLTGIMKMGDNYGAVINGRIVYAEHYVDGAIVKSVERDRVTLAVDGRDVVVRLY